MKEREEDSLSRRHFLIASALASGGLLLPISARAQNSMPMQSATPSAPDQSGAANVTLRITRGLLELAPDHIVSTTLYNGQFPGPLLRFKEGEPVTVDVFNDTDTPELVHWHGQIIPS